MDFKDLTIEKAQKLLSGGEVTAEELAEESLEKIEKKGDLNAFLDIYGDKARLMAKEADERLKKGDRAPLLGIPLAIKDNILVKDEKATSASKMLENYKASYDAEVIKKLRAQGAVFVGKTNLDEFAMGTSTENSAFGPTKNPHNTERVPGGSSGGSAVAVAADMCLGALGSDTGGSIRQPASFCGVVGMKPTYGRVSRHGLMALGSSLDQIGPLAKTVRDAEIIFYAIKGRDSLDATSFIEEKKTTDKKIEDLTIGVPKEYFEVDGLNEKVKEKVQNAINWFQKKGAEIKEINLPYSKYGLAVYYIIMPAEASSNLARYDGIRYGFSSRKEKLLESYLSTKGEGFGPEPIRRIMIGTYVLSAGYYDAFYKKAKAVQAMVKDDFKKSFKDVDVIMTPVSPTTAFKLGEKVQDPLQMYAADIFTVPLNIAGLPGMSVPCGEVNGLPVGLQIISSWGEEDLLFKVGDFYEGKN